MKCIVDVIDVKAGWKIPLRHLVLCFCLERVRVCDLLGQLGTRRYAVLKLQSGTYTCTV
jgi:hypothetical protein